MWRSAVQVCLGLHIAARQCVPGMVRPAWDYSSDYFAFPLGGLAQLARAPALQAGGQRFESVILHLMGAAPDGAVIPVSIFDMLYKQDCSRKLTYVFPAPVPCMGTWRVRLKV